MSFYLYSINTGFYINSSGYVGILNSNPQYPLDISGDCKSINTYTNHLVSLSPNGYSPSYTTDANTFPSNSPGGTITINGNDTIGTIKVSVGGGLASSSLGINISFSKKYPSPPELVFIPMNSPAFNLIDSVSASNITNNGFKMSKGSSPSFSFFTDYIWKYLVIGTGNY